MRHNKQNVVKILYYLRIDILFAMIERLIRDVYIYRINKQSVGRLRFIEEGLGSVHISGDPHNFQIDETSYLKPGTYVQCSGGVKIGKYCHLARGVTILSTAHEYDNRPKIPYDEIVTKKPVTIMDFVMVGCNSTILGGVTIGEGAIIGAGSVVSRDVPDYAIAAGNPCKIIKHRDVEHFKRLKETRMFY
jgi:acetyltransferase-like isoleucine patch superfamily enzyme